MSEFHPNRTKQVRTKPRLTMRRVLECWPFLVWLAVAIVGFKVYRSGVVFVRMNGAVDVYQENVTPQNDGRLLELKVKRGDRVNPGDVVAIMDASDYKLEMDSLQRDIVADRMADIRDYDSELIKLDGELRELQTENGEDEAIIKSLESLVDDSIKARPGANPELERMRQNDPDIVRARTELAKAKGRNRLNATHQKAVQDNIDRMTTFRNSLNQQAELISKFGLGSKEVTEANALRDDEFQKFLEIKANLEHCQLKTFYGGTVDRIEKEIGEFVQTGESVLRIVGDPVQIVCFLPQDQAADLKNGDTVWVANTSNKAQIFQTKVIGVSPRINNLPDTTSPLPNRRVHGRDVILAYPPEAIVNGTPVLIPGQTVIVHLQKPGADNWLDRLIHNDDNDKVR
jgi:multidrug resistance efflux pump